MRSGGAPRGGTLRNFHRPIENSSLPASVPGTLFDQTRVNFFEEARDGGGYRGTNLQESLGNGIHRFDIGKSGALEDVDVVERAAIDVGERQEGERDVILRVKAEVVAQIGNVRAEIAVRQHHALGLAGSARGVDDGGKLARENL